MKNLTAVIYADQPEFTARLDRLNPQATVGTLVIEDSTDRAEITVDRAGAERIIAALRPMLQPELDDKNVRITAALAARMASGMGVRDAIDDLFGPGAYVSIAGEIYDALRAKAVSP